MRHPKPDLIIPPAPAVTAIQAALTATAPAVDLVVTVPKNIVNSVAKALAAPPTTDHKPVAARKTVIATARVVNAA